MDLVFVADQKDGGDVFIIFQGAFHAGDDNAAAVIPAHDIHCNAHVFLVFNF
jgi:hypothetical protein